MNPGFLGVPPKNIDLLSLSSPILLDMGESWLSGLGKRCVELLMNVCEDRVQFSRGSSNAAHEEATATFGGRTAEKLSDVT